MKRLRHKHGSTPRHPACAFPTGGNDCERRKQRTRQSVALPLPLVLSRHSWHAGRYGVRRRSATQPSKSRPSASIT